MVMASNAHTLLHLLHPIQSTLQAFLATAPLSLFTQETYILIPFFPLFLSSMILLGQAFTHAPQATHLSSFTSGRRVLGFMEIAPKLHTATQSPHPRHPYLHPVSPAYSPAFTLQELLPS